MKTVNRTETLYSCYTHHIGPWCVYCDISVTTQCAPGPVHSKGKIGGFLLQVLFAHCSFRGCKWIWPLHSTSIQKSVLEQQIRRFSFKEGRGLATSMLLQWHLNHCHQCVVIAAHQPCKLSICTDIQFFVTLHHFASTSWHHNSSHLHKSKSKLYNSAAKIPITTN